MPMRHRSRHTGAAHWLALAALAALIACTLGESLIQVRESLKKATALQTQRRFAGMQDALLGHAMLNGWSSPSELGRLPLPDVDGDGLAGRSSGNAQNSDWLGRWPVFAYRYTGGQKLAADAQHPCRFGCPWYAVSPSWLGVVDAGFEASGTQPSTVTVLDAQDRILTRSAVAVVAARLSTVTQPNGVATVQITLPGTWIEKAQWQAAVDKGLLFSALHALTPVLGSGASVDTLEWLSTGDTPQLRGTQPGQGTCVCTKTRCTCSADLSMPWASSGACLSGSPCQGTGTDAWGKPVQMCTSTATTACAFSAAAGPLHPWPVQKTSPGPAAKTPCVLSGGHYCGLSSAGCTCTYGWPSILTQGASSGRNVSVNVSIPGAFAGPQWRTLTARDTNQSATPVRRWFETRMTAQ